MPPSTGSSAAPTVAGSPAATPGVQPAPAGAPGPSTGELAEPTGNPPGPVLTIAPLPDGDFLAGVGPIGDAETGFEWRLYRGHAEVWQRLTWPPEAIPRSLHPTPSGGLIFAVPFSNALFGRGQAWGLMRSGDGGHSWQQATSGLDDPYVMDLALSPAFSTDHTLFVVTWYNGVYRSTDAGETWQPIPLTTVMTPTTATTTTVGIEPSGGPNPYDLALAVSPDYRGRTDASFGNGLVMASFSRRLHRWDPATQVWQTIPLTVTTTVKDFDPPQAQLTAGAIAFSLSFTDDGTIYLDSGYAGLFRSADRGETWLPINHRLRFPSPPVVDFHLAVASANEAYVLLPTGETDPILRQAVRVLYRTRDGGASWQALKDPSTLGWVSAFALTRDAGGRAVLHLGGSRGGVSSYLANSLTWD